MNARAAILDTFGSPLRLATISLRAPLAGEALVRIVWAGVCHTDIAQADGEHVHPLPVVLGHEGAGIVTEVGPGVDTVAVGDRVTFNLAAGCGSCRQCRRGYPVHCLRAPEEGRLATGPSPISTADGSVASYGGASCFATHAVVSAASLIRLPADVPLDVGAVIGCAVITGFGAVVNAISIRPGSRGAVVGGGGVGVAAIQAARAVGAAEVTIVDPLPARRSGALACGATGELDPSDEASVRRLRQRAGADGWQWAVVAAPSVAAIELAVQLLGPRGTVVVVGTPPGSFTLSVADLVDAEKTVRGSTYGSGRPDLVVEQIIALYRAGSLDLEALISHSLPLAEIDEAVRMARAGEGLRILLACSPEDG